MQENASAFTPLELDAIGEILNISLGSSATAISNLLDKRVDITTPNVSVVSFDEFEFTELEPAIGVEIMYVEGLEGNNIMLLKRGDIKVIVELLMSCEIPDEEFEINEMNLSAICEVMNQMMGASSTALAEFLGEPVNISTPVSFQIDDTDEFKNKYFSADEPMMVVRFKLKIESVLESEFLNLMPIKLAKRIVSAFSLPDVSEEVQQPSAAPQPAAPPPPPQPQPVAPPPPPPQPAATPQPVYQPAPEPAPPPVYTQPAMPAAPRVIQAQHQSAAAPEMINMERLSSEVPANLGLIMSVPLQISVEIGRTRKPLKEILEFTQGTLVVLDKLAGEHVDLFVNGQCVAKGDVVVVDDYFGIRVTEIVKPLELPDKQ